MLGLKFNPISERVPRILWWACFAFYGRQPFPCCVYCAMIERYISTILLSWNNKYCPYTPIPDVQWLCLIRQTSFWRFLHRFRSRIRKIVCSPLRRKHRHTGLHTNGSFTCWRAGENVSVVFVKYICNFVLSVMIKSKQNIIQLVQGN